MRSAGCASLREWLMRIVVALVIALLLPTASAWLKSESAGLKPHLHNSTVSTIEGTGAFLALSVQCGEPDSVLW